MGVPVRHIEVLLETRDGAINYVCCECRIGRREDEDTHTDLVDRSHALKQLMTAVQGVVGELREVKSELRMKRVETNNPLNEVTRTTAERQAQVRSEGSSVRGAPLSEDFLRSVREINERDKRKRSIVIRGLGDLAIGDAADKIKEVCAFLGLGNIVVTDIVKVHSSLFRGTIADVESRLKLLIEAKKLKDSVHRNIFIQRDLTYMQRQQLALRRSQGGGAHRAGTDQPALRGQNVQRDHDSRASPMRSRSFHQSRPAHGDGSPESYPRDRWHAEGRGGGHPPSSNADHVSNGGHLASRGRGGCGSRGGGHSSGRTVRTVRRGGGNPTGTAQIRRNAFLH